MQFYKTSKCSSKQRNTRHFTSSVVRFSFFVYVNRIFNCQRRDTIQLQSLLFRQVSGLEKRGYTIIPEVVGCPLLQVSTATGPQNTKNFLVLCQGFCVHSCVNCICLRSVSCFPDWNGQETSYNSHVNSEMKSPKYLPAGLEALPWLAIPFNLYWGIQTNDLKENHCLEMQLQKL